MSVLQSDRESWKIFQFREKELARQLKRNLRRIRFWNWLSGNRSQAREIQAMIEYLHGSKP